MVPNNPRFSTGPINPAETEAARYGDAVARVDINFPFKKIVWFKPLMT